MKKNEQANNATTVRRAQHPMIYWMTVITLVMIVLAFVIFPALRGVNKKNNTESIGKYKGITLPSDSGSFYSLNLSYSLRKAEQTAQYYAKQYTKDSPADFENMYQSYLKRLSADASKNAKNSTLMAYAVDNLFSITGSRTTEERVMQIIVENCGASYNSSVDFRLDDTKSPGKSNFSWKKYKLAKGRNNLMINKISEIYRLQDQLSRFTYALNLLSTFSDSEKASVDTLNSKRAWVDYFKITDSMIDDEELVNFVDDNPDLFISLDLRMIRLDDKKVANEVYASIQETPEIFIEQAEIHNSTTMKNKKGRIEGLAADIATKVNLDNKQIETILELETGEFSKLIKIDDFYYIFKAENDPVTSETKTLLSSQRENIVKVIRQKDASLYQTLLDNTALEIKDRCESEGFDSVASIIKASITKIEDFPINFGNSKSYNTISQTQLATNETFLYDVFSSKEGDIIEPIRSGLDKLICKVVKFEEKDNKSRVKEQSLTQELLIKYVTDPLKYKQTATAQ